MDYTQTNSGTLGTERPIFYILAASLGTAFEWYDFFLYTAVAPVFAKQFFGTLDSNVSYLFALLAFAAGFAVRPLGAVFFGRLGDVWGRKNIFLATMLTMGTATVAVGLLPTSHTIGLAAPVLLVVARICQGFAVGGEYGGAAVYIAERAPEGQRGYYTSFIQVTCTFGLALALIAVLLTRKIVGEVNFQQWAWRVPFLLSAALVVVSLWIRLNLAESPVFKSLLTLNILSSAPLAESFSKSNRARLFLATFGLTAGMTVIFYNSQVYSAFFLEKVLRVDGQTVNFAVTCALLAATPFFVIFGSLSDKYGRKTIIVAACLLAAVGYMPLFKAMAVTANPALVAATRAAPVTIVAPPNECSLQFDLIGRATLLTSCDIAKSALATSGVSYNFEDGPVGQATLIKIGNTTVEGFPGKIGGATALISERDSLIALIKTTLHSQGYPSEASKISPATFIKIVGILFAMVLLVTMAYGPLAAILVEMFPPRIRTTSLSISYNTAVGLLGGFLPAVAFVIVIVTGNIFAGLWYPISVAAFGGIVSLFFVKDDRTMTSI